MRGGRCRAALALAAISLFTACFDLGPESQRDELEKNRELWQSRQPARYVYAIERQCFCPEEARGPVRVTVQGGTVVSQLYVGDGRAVEGAATDWFPGVNGLFDVLRAAFDGGAHDVRATYDPEFGVPVDFWIDYSETTIDEELGFTVTEAVQAIS